MGLFSTVDCRLCSLSLTRVRLYRPLEGGDGVSSFTIAVKMQSSKRAPTRSSDIPYVLNNYPEDPHKVFDCELDLQFSLQYPHFIKRGGNQLVVMIQRKKKYKNRTMLGYKTLAQNTLNMCEVLQGPVDKELMLFEPRSDNPDKEKRGSVATPVAVLTMGSLSTLPVVEDSVVGLGLKGISINERFSDDDSDDNSSEVSDEDGTAAGGGTGGGGGRTRRRSLRKTNRRGSLKTSLLSPNAEEPPSGGGGGGVGAQSQRNIKQKFIALLRKFRAADDVEGASDGEQSAMGDGAAEERRRLEDLLFDELSNLSDLSGGQEENDDLSITSTPKPSLRPFFSSLTLVPPNQDGISKSPTNFISATKASASESDESACDSTPDEKKLFEDEPGLPSSCYLLHSSERHSAAVASALKSIVKSVSIVASGPELKAALGALVQRVQNFCNNNSRNPTSIKVVLMGDDSFVNHLLRVYVEQFSSKTPEWINYFRFFLIPLSQHEAAIARYLASVDSSYPFADSSWFEALAGAPLYESEIASRIARYVNSPVTSVLQLPIAEVMLTLAKQDSTQAFVPFVTEVRIEGVEDSTSPPGDSKATGDNKVTPPNSPAQAGHQASIGGISGGSGSAPGSGRHSRIGEKDKDGVGGGRSEREFEPMELQIDFWTVNNKEANKCTLKGIFRHLQVRRMPPSHLLTLSYSTKEKVKQKVMRLGKKKTSTGADEGTKQADGVQRLICSSKNAPLRITIDGTEWTNVKFFQLSSQWQTHVKTVPFAVNQMAPAGGNQMQTQSASLSERGIGSAGVEALGGGSTDRSSNAASGQPGPASGRQQQQQQQQTIIDEL
ncbi:phosphofurin acidic cluster sorting protein 1-like isoform X2 [Varroa jacobsoni]|uniref:Phosphofurin acidic cluster sorting protein 2 n=1 Tax=Varroa destructor TaxID=109461 RepID=A0A7M7MAN5_VARDE|nr:phosphofurin acidic cluster sorting protein 2-like isoform X3 [Varroa destructor]XP_022695959.1 phosphofurin acidic cluster sorting protein 1-like isoform X2 [Varroa jacobsoni]